MKKKNNNNPETEIADISKARATYLSFSKRPRSVIAEEKKLEILNSNNPRELVESMPSLDFYITVKDLGVAEALELIELASPQIIRDCIDIDGWQKDEPNMQNTALWLAAVLETKGEPELINFIEETDDELISLWFKKAFNIYALFEEADPNVETVNSLVMTPDNRYLIEIKEESEFGAVLAKLLNSLYAIDMVYAEKLLEGARHETDTLLTEDMLKYRTNRMEELGFSSYTEAIEIFTLVDPDVQIELISSVPHSPQPVTGGQALAIWNENEDDILKHALELISNNETQDLLTQSFATFANKLAVAFNIPIIDEKDFPETLQSARGFIALALEYRSKNDLQTAVTLLSTANIQLLFRIGYSLVKRWYLSLKAFFNKGFFGDGKTTPTFLDDSYLAFYEELKERIPKLVEIGNQLSVKEVRDFCTLGDLALLEEQSEEMSFLAFPFWRILNLNKETLASHKSNTRLTCSTIFNTWLLNGLISRAQNQNLHPLNAEELSIGLNLILKNDNKQAPAISEQAYEYCEKNFIAKVKNENATLAGAAERFYKRSLLRLLEETSGISRTLPLSPKYIASLWGDA